MISLKYYNYSQIGGDNLQMLVKKCNGLNVITASVVDDDFIIDIKNEQQNNEIERYNRIKSLKDQKKELEVGVMMKNKRNELIWNKWSKKRGDKTNYELFKDALEASKSSTTRTPGRLTIPSGFKLPGAPEPSEPKIDYSQYKTMLKVGVESDNVATKMKNDLKITKEAADKIIKDGFPTPTESISSAAAELSGPDPRYARYAKMKKVNLPNQAIIIKMKSELGITQDEAEEIIDNNFKSSSSTASPTSVTSVPVSTTRPAFLAGISGATLKKPKAIVAKPTVEDFLISEGFNDFNRKEYNIYKNHIVPKQGMKEMLFAQYNKNRGNAVSDWDKLFTDKGITVIPPESLETKYSEIHKILQSNGDQYKPLSGGYYTILYSV